MGISPPRQVKSHNRAEYRPRRTPWLLFDHLEGRLALAASPAFSISDVTIIEGNAGTIGASFTVRLSQASNKQVAVNYATSDGTAVAGLDYDTTRGTLTFARGQTSKTITVPIRGDTLDEAAESFFVNLSAPTQKTTIRKGTGVGIIVDDDPPPAIVIGDATISEGDKGSVSATFDVTLSAPSGLPVTVSYSTANGTATAGSDYTPTAGTLTFAPGQTSLTVAVPVINDTIDEDNETFFLNLSTPTNATITDAQGVGTIVDDDPAPSLSINNPGSLEGNTGVASTIFTVTLSAASERVVTVSYTTTDNSATAGSDYVATSGLLTFLPGQTSQTISVPILGDTTNEPDESFFVHLGTAVNATIAAGEGVGTILNDDPTPNLSFAIEDASVVEGNSGLNYLVFRVVLSNPSNSLEWVVYQTADSPTPGNGYATAGEDYTPQRTDRGITFLPGVTEQTISIPIFVDTKVEPNEVFYVKLIRASQTIADGLAEGTIINDD